MWVSHKPAKLDHKEFRPSFTMGENRYAPDSFLDFEDFIGFCSLGKETRKIPKIESSCRKYVKGNLRNDA